MYLAIEFIIMFFVYSSHEFAIIKYDAHETLCNYLLPPEAPDVKGKNAVFTNIL